MLSGPAAVRSAPLWPPGAGAPAAQPVQVWSGLSPDALRARLAVTDVPAVISDLVAGLPGLADWSPQMLRRHAQTPVKWLQDPDDRAGSVVEVGARRKRVHATLGEFLDAVERASGPPVYLIKALARTLAPELDAAVAPLRACLPKPATYGPPAGPDVTGPFFWMGQGGVTSPLHFEPECNLAVQLQGVKEWILFPPEDSADLYAPCAEHPEAFRHWSPVDLCAPDRQRFPRFFGLRPFRHVLRAGETLYVPGGWWHGVRYSGPTASVNLFWPARTAAVVETSR